jgi:diguanylate cyclase (GGDEF)-like protein
VKTSRWRRAGRRAAKVSIGAVACAFACVVVGVGGVDGASLLGARIPLPQAMVATATLALVAIAVIRRVQFTPPSARAQRVSMWLAAAEDLADLELALALVAGVHVVIAVTGGQRSPAYPLLYAIVAFAATVLARPGAIATLGAALFLEGALLVRTGIADVTAITAGLHVIYLAGAAAAHAVLLRGLATRYRRRRAKRLDDELVALRDSARDYRLIASALGPGSRAPRSRDEEERLLAIGGVGMIGDATSWVLATLKRSLAARTVALLWVEDDDHVKLKDIVSDADDITETPRLPSAGVLGAVLRDRAPLIVGATKPGQVPYYDGARAGVALVAVPILETGHLRGILVADRDAAFAEADRDLLADATAQVLRVVQAEQVFRAVERAKYEHERFYQATAMLGRALTPEQVMETAFDACAAIVEVDVAAIALYDKDRARHRVAAVRIAPGGEGLVEPRQLAELEFRDNAGLASMVVKNRHYLPAAGEPRELSAPIYTRKVKLDDDAKSLLVLPLLSADEAIGTLTLVARAEKRFTKDIREMLAVIANQVAVSLQNGFLYKKMETMATTDGLTGLTNHRSFQSRFEDLLQRATRHNHKVALLLCDVDHFKKVNDNYGHPIGDEVLRRVAKVLQEVPRKIDIPARYGGEEFAVLLDGVDVAQAKAVAERIRIEIAKTVVETDKGPLSVTESVGVAAFPDDGRDRETLIERADLALYHAKHTGRNRVVTWAEAQAAKTRKAG